MNTNRISCLYIFGFLSIALVGCSGNVILDKKLQIKNSEWTYRDTLVYNFTVEDTSKSVDFLLDVNYNADFGYENLYTEVTTIFPNGDNTKETLSFELRSTDALSQTKCNGGNCTVPIVMLENANFSQKGSHTIKINQFSRVDTLIGVESLRLSIVRG
jgi:gliding motility-associated lipoprotein GldH